MLFPAALPVIAYTALSAIVQKYPSIIGYVSAATLYEGIRTFSHVKNACWHASSFCNGYRGLDVPLLLTERVAASIFCSLQGIFVAPVHAVEDIKWMELRGRGLDPLRYGYTPREVSRGGYTYMSYLDIVTDNRAQLPASSGLRPADT